MFGAPRRTALTVAAISVATIFATALAGSGVASARVLARPPAIQARAGVTLTGAGSTFDNPFFTSAFFTYHSTHPTVTVNYAAVGSSSGIAQFQSNTVNFGATDVPMTSDQIAQAKGPTLQVPVALGGVTVSYHIPNAKTGLQLTGATVANIYLGKITYWDDRAIKASNPGVHLPHLKIVVVHRSDGSGTTYIFTDYLSRVSSTWRSGPGTNTTINWPAGVGQVGNAGVAAVVAQTVGAIGYVELAYAKSNQFTFARIQNSSKNYILPGPNSIASAAASKPTVSPTNFSIVNAPGSRSYPISGYSWMLVYQKQTSAANGLALSQLAQWLTHTGQQLGKPLYYVPLPAAIQAVATNTLKKMVGPDGKPFL